MPKLTRVIKRKATHKSPRELVSQENWVHQDGEHEIPGHVTSQAWSAEISEFNLEEDRSNSFRNPITRTAIIISHYHCPLKNSCM